MAIGKVSGLYNALLAMNGGDENVQEELINLMCKYAYIWDSLHINTESASVFSNRV
jgi:hypothetical protein